MNARDKKILKQNRVVLIKSLEIDSVLDVLEAEVLSSTMVNDLRIINNPKQQNTKFLNLLEKRGPKAFELFKSALESSQQFNLLNVLSHDATGKQQFNTNTTSAQSSRKRPEDTFDTTYDQNIHLMKGTSFYTPLTKEVRDTTGLFGVPNIHWVKRTTPNTDIVRECSLQAVDDKHELELKDVVDGPEDDLLIHASSPEFMMAKQCDSYKMTSRTRGLALLICIHEFEEGCGFDDRKGGMVDVLRLQHVLTQLQFVCHRLINGNFQDIWEVLLKFGSMTQHSKYNCMFIAVMSHGSEGVFYARDGRSVNIEQMMSIYNNVNCPRLQNKPKIFIIQACRGKTPDMGTDEIDGGGNSPVNTYYSDGPQQHARLSFPRVPYFPPNKLPINSDYFVGYGSVSGYAAMRNTAKGSWFIQAFVRALARHAHDRHFLEIMTEVNRLVMKREGQNPRGAHHRCKAMSESRNTLCKLLYFFPGLQTAA